MTDDPIFGTAKADVLRVDDSVTFTWVRDPGNSYTENDRVLAVGDYGSDYMQVVRSAPSSASGSITFQHVASSQMFTATPSSFGFGFSNGASVGADNLTWSDSWTWNPVTGVLDPNYAGGSWDNWIGVFFQSDSAAFGTAHWSGDTSDTEHGHWALLPDIHDVDVFGGSGNDTIWGGQGTEILSGDEGDDKIFAGRGEQTVFGGDGNDQLHGGAGSQILDGGDGNDTIWAGGGGQIVMGDTGNDLIYGGSGADTLWGGTGRDTLWAGSGDQILDGGTAADELHAGAGNDTLTGGQGCDVFVFGASAAGRDVITDFRIGTDIVQVAHRIDGLSLAGVNDLAHRIAAGPDGAVLDLGAGMTITFAGLSAAQLAAHALSAFRVV